MNSPAILFIIFNRPDTTKVVFESIRLQKPSRLFIAADGPRNSVLSDAAQCEATKEIVKQIDWPCEVHHRFLTDNVGCTQAVSEAISWFFTFVEEGVILEDDCVPHPSFFKFAGELLDYYRDDLRVMHISGDNFIKNKKRGKGSYYFSRYTYAWGWATWARAWKYYNPSLEREKKHIWDAQWRLSVEAVRGLAVIPNVNLISNIGCAHPLATHTTDFSSNYSNLETHEMHFPLLHPKRIKDMTRYSDYTPNRPVHTMTALFITPVIQLGSRVFLKPLKNLVPKKIKENLRKKFGR